MLFKFVLHISLRLWFLRELRKVSFCPLASGAEADKTGIQGQVYYEQSSYDGDSSGQTSETTTEEDLSHEIHKLQLKKEPDKVAIFE